MKIDLALQGYTSIRLWIERKPSGILVGTSPDLPGLHIVERSYIEVLSSARELAPVLIAEAAPPRVE